MSRLQISPDSTAYVLDSHRPFHIENVYANEKVHLLVNNSEMSELQLPDVEKVIQEDSDDDEDNEENRGSYEQQMENIRRKAVKREEMQAWERQRQRTLWKYYESTWFSTPSCVTLLELAAEMNRVSAEIMWYTAVGLNSAMVDKLVSFRIHLVTTSFHLFSDFHRNVHANLRRSNASLCSQISAQKYYKSGKSR